MKYHYVEFECEKCLRKFVAHIDDNLHYMENNEVKYKRVGLHKTNESCICTACALKHISK